MSEKEKDKNKKTERKNQLPSDYKKPSITSEDLMAFAASCNGTNTGNRKSSIGSPHFCNSRKLNS